MPTKYFLQKIILIVIFLVFCYSYRLFLAIFAATNQIKQQV